MGRHKEEGSAITHVRVSVKMKQRLDELKAKNGFPTTDQVLDYYLGSDADYMIRRYVSLDDEAIKRYLDSDNEMLKRCLEANTTEKTIEDINNYVQQQPTAEDMSNYVKQQDIAMQDSINKIKEADKQIINKLINQTSKDLTQYINKSRPRNYSTTKVNHKPKWRNRKSRLRYRLRHRW